MTKTNKSGFSTEQEVLNYIACHSEWQKLGKLHHFTQRISELTSDKALRLFFSKEIARLRVVLEEQATNMKACAPRRNIVIKTSCETELGDIYGDPKFYRFGDCGRSRKKRGQTDFMKKKI